MDKGVDPTLEQLGVQIAQVWVWYECLAHTTAGLEFSRDTNVGLPLTFCKLNE